MCRADSDGLITTCPKSDPIVTSDCLLRWVSGGCCQILLLDGRKKRGAELQVRGADGLMDVFVGSFSVPNGGAATHQSAGSIWSPTRLLGHTG